MADTNLYLDASTYDLAVDPSTNNLRITQTPTEYLSQKLEGRLQQYLGEWWLDPSGGVPWFENALKKQPDLALVQDTIVSTALDTPGVSEIASIMVDFDQTARKFKAELTVLADFGELVTVEVQI